MACRARLKGSCEHIKLAAWRGCNCWRSGFGGVLADDMGLGKTVQFLAHLAIEEAHGRLRGPVLIIAPTSVLPNWRAEIARFVPNLRVVSLSGNDRAERFDRIEDNDVALTSYALLHRDADRLTEREWQMVVLDEAQFVKNPRSKGAHAAARLRAAQRVALTGTPIENHLEELWSIFSFAIPGLLGDRTQLRASFARRSKNAAIRNAARSWRRDYDRF